MTTKFENQEFECIYDRDSAGRFSDLIFDRCLFDNCAFSICETPSARSIARNVQFINCKQKSCTLRSGILENVYIKNLHTNGLLQFFGTALQHVVLEGEIGTLMFSSDVDLLGENPSKQQAFDQANELYYSRVDWALDISNAHFHSITLRGIPGELVIRDEESQGLVLKSDLQDNRWMDYDFDGTYWKATLAFIQKSKWDSGVLAVLRLNRNASAFQKVLDFLRSEGIAS